MNLARFGLRRPAFAAVPDVRAYVPLPAHEAALAAISRARDNGAGLALLDGTAGTGKTMAAMRFVSGLPAAHPCLVIPSAKFARPADLFQAMLFDLGAEYRGLSETELRLAVADRLLVALAADTPAVVVLDEAQHLGDEVLEEVRLLGNLGGCGVPAAFVLLVGRPGLRERLTAAGLGTVSARVRLELLDRDEAMRLVRGQLGSAEAVLDEEAAGVIADHGRGSPRLLNQLTAEAFALAVEAGAEAVDVEVALEAAARLGLAESARDEPGVLVLPDKPAARRTRKRKSA